MATPAKKIPAAKMKTMRTRITSKERILFAKYLGIMIKVGLPLTDGLDALINETTYKPLKLILTSLKKDVENGQSLANALGRYPRAFDEFFVNLVRVGEESGKLADNLEYLADQLERSEELRRKVFGALLYPAIVFVGTLGVTGFLAFVTLPQLIPIFASLRVKLPLSTRILIASSGWITHNVQYVVLTLVVLVILFRVGLTNPRFRFAMHSLELRIPVLGGILKNAQLTSFSRVLGTLLRSGVEVVRALDITGRSMTNLVYKQELQNIAKNMQGRGENIADYLKRHERLFPSVATRMIQLGEKTGKLDDSLFYVSGFYEKEIDNTVKTLTNVLEPAVLIFIGVLVGFVALSIITPIYELTRGIGK